MKWVVFLMAALVSQTTMAGENPKASYDTRQLLTEINPDLGVAATYYLRTFSGQGAKNNDAAVCTLIVSPRSDVPMSKPTDSSLDIFLLVENKIVGSVNLRKKISDYADDYQQLQVSVDPARPGKLQLTLDVGHFTDQVNGYNGYIWNFEKTSKDGFSIKLQHNWADDDGLTGGSDYECQF